MLSLLFGAEIPGNTVNLFLSSFIKRAWMVQIWPGQAGEQLEQESAFGPAQLCRLGGLTGAEHISWSEPREEPTEISWYETEKGHKAIIGMVAKEGHLYFFIFEESSYLVYIHIEEWQLHWLTCHFTIYMKGQSKAKQWVISTWANLFIA